MGTVEERSAAAARIVTRGPLLIAGLRAQFSCVDPQQIAALWQRFAPQIESLPARVGGHAYGVCIDCSGSDTFDYLCGVEVADFTRVPANWARLTIPETSYAIFSHGGHVSELRETIGDIFDRWLPASSYEPAATDAEIPDLFERYGERFNPQSGSGDIEIWIPIREPNP